MSATDQLQGINIASVLRQEGPIVSCVVLRASKEEEEDDKKKSADNSSSDHLVEEIKVDTTPKKNSVEKILGGPFTFVGQYEEEGIMLIAKQGCVHDEKDETNTEEYLNPHKLQPPFDKAKIYGDVLLLKVAECEDPLDDPATTKPVEMVTNDEFFLNYTKEEYLTFAARTDVVPPALPSDNEDDDEEEGCLEEEEENDWSGCEEGEDDEEDVSEEEAQAAMMNLLMTAVLRKFQEENGRGPSTEELLVLKMTVAQKLGIPREEDGNNNDIDEESPNQEKEEQSEESKKRGTEDSPAEATSEPQSKKVKFDAEVSNETVAPAVFAK